MRINFLVNEVAGGWEPTDTRLGGTEESVVRWAEELAKLGHTVTVFRNPGDADLPMLGDVFYAPRNEYDNRRGVGVTINIKSSEVLPAEPTLYLTNETNASELDLSAYLGVIWPSQWADENIPVNNPRRFILPHGYDSSQIYPGEKIPKQCLYASSPDRGLDILLEAWPSVVAAHPDATLLVTYGAEPVDLPNVYFMGEVDEETMNDLYRTSEYWVHPCTGGELFGISGIKAQAAGCWPVYIPTMALAETVRFGTKSTKETFADDLIKALSDRPTVPKMHFVDWKESTLRLLEIIQEVV